MVFYEFTLEYDTKASANNGNKGKTGEKANKWSDYASEINEHLGIECGLDGNISLLVTGGKFGKLQLLATCRLENVSLRACREYICKTMREAVPGSDHLRITDEREVCAKDIHSICKRASGAGVISGRGWFPRDLSLDYFDNCQFKIKEKNYSEFTYEEAMERACQIMADDTLLQELERIYAGSNIDKFYGHPVHYKLTVGDPEAAMEIAEVLIPALCANRRMLGHRLEHLYSIEEGCYAEEDMDHVFENAQGNAVLIELKGSDGMHGNYASSYESVVDYFDELIRKYALNTLCLFVDNTEHPGFSQSMIAKVREHIDIVEIKEGAGDYDKAVEFFQRLTEKTDFPATEKEVRKILPKKKLYTVSEVYEAYKKWYGNGLKNRIYTAYRTCEMVEVHEDRQSSAPYQELQNMVGLSELKKVVDQIIATGKMQQIRSQMGLDSYKSSMHMIFTGNPGSAKTTVARLLSQILKKEGILDSGRFVEVGRADLIARYVGWTAKTVCQKFREASGGVLFIDEAYSLVDNSNTFGDEAINTIVQEMENHRDDVIVIFAGYPEKMKVFLEKNEGLRSRIAFHLNFPDYNAEELWQILKLMAKQKGYRLAEGIETMCMDIFSTACSHDEFGNGRFARNVLEQAIMHQSERLFNEYKGKKIPKSKLLELIPADFETNAGQQFKEKKGRIGFAV
ncbi:MAG: AAA family ATPase [bacterium]|nr:AAA family ATPase [bacterium]MDY4099146.1 AAA family ATPase [Lachnospiraceae bacterium]